MKNEKYNKREQGIPLICNKGSFSLELITIVLVVIFVGLLGLRTFGSQISRTIHDTTNTIETVANNVLNQHNSGGRPGGSTTPSLDLTNINVTDGDSILARGDFSTKGNLVTINDTQYRVLAVDGTMAKVMSMENYIETEFNTSSITIDFNGTRGQKYADSFFDTEMTNYYNSLPTIIKNGLVEQNINQTKYAHGEGNAVNADFNAWLKGSFTEGDVSGTTYNLKRLGEANVGNRYVYVLDLDDVISYLGPTSTAKDVNEMFFNQRNSVSQMIGLRSAVVEGGVAALWGEYGALNYVGNDETLNIRPAFVIDLSLLS